MGFGMIFSSVVAIATSVAEIADQSIPCIGLSWNLLTFRRFCVGFGSLIHSRRIVTRVQYMVVSDVQILCSLLRKLTNVVVNSFMIDSLRGKNVNNVYADVERISLYR